MAGPMMSGPVAAQQVQQVQQQQQVQQPAKQGGSKFDGMMADKAQQANGANGPQNATAAQATQQANQVSQASQANKAQSVQATQKTTELQQTRKAEGMRRSDPVQQSRETGRANAAQRSGAGEAPQGLQNAAENVQKPSTATHLGGLLSDIEKGQGLMDKLISGGLSGKSFNNSELLALQAGMYKFTQELELTGKVVEKATTGLKDTLKTQV